MTGSCRRLDTGFLRSEDWAQDERLTNEAGGGFVMSAGGENGTGGEDPKGAEDDGLDAVDPGLNPLARA